MYCINNCYLYTLWLYASILTACYDRGPKSITRACWGPTVWTILWIQCKFSRVVQVGELSGVMAAGWWAKDEILSEQQQFDNIVIMHLRNIHHLLLGFFIREVYYQFVSVYVAQWLFSSLHITLILQLKNFDRGITLVLNLQTSHHVETSL